MTKKCIVCQKDVDAGNAVRVKEDAIIRAIRRIKSVLGIDKGNELYVCNEDLKVHADKRKSYEKSMIISLCIGGGVFLFLVALPLLGGKFEAGFFFASFFLCALVGIIPIFFKYVPEVEAAAGSKNDNYGKAVKAAKSSTRIKKNKDKKNKENNG